MVSLPQLQPRRSRFWRFIFGTATLVLYGALGFVALLALRALWWAAGRLLGLPSS